VQQTTRSRRLPYHVSFKQRLILRWPQARERV